MSSYNSIGNKDSHLISLDCSCRGILHIFLVHSTKLLILLTKILIDFPKNIVLPSLIKLCKINIDKKIVCVF